MTLCTSCRSAARHASMPSTCTPNTAADSQPYDCAHPKYRSTTCRNQADHNSPTRSPRRRSTWFGCSPHPEHTAPQPGSCHPCRTQTAWTAAAPSLVTIRSRWPNCDNTASSRSSRLAVSEVTSTHRQQTGQIEPNVIDTFTHLKAHLIVAFLTRSCRSMCSSSRSIFTSSMPYWLMSASSDWRVVSPVIRIRSTGTVASSCVCTTNNVGSMSISCKQMQTAHSTMSSNPS